MRLSKKLGQAFFKEQKVMHTPSRRIILGCLLAGLIAIRFIPDGGEFYATCIYPSLSYGMSFLSSWCPWSLEEVTVCLFGALLLLFPLIALCCRKGGKTILKGEAEILLWLIAWFYWGWGCTYFRNPFYERMMIEEAEYTPAAFQQFLTAYTDSLNAAYVPDPETDKESIRKEIKAIYRQLPPGYGLTKPYSFQEPKLLLFNELYSQVGVLGYMGPFFAESQVNMSLDPLEYPFTYAHELSHLLGISSEAEANFWAFETCIRSKNPTIRYSAYNGLLAYVANNARMALDKEAYEKWFATIRQEVINDENRLAKQWKERKNPTLNAAQDWLYNLYLKGNDIPQGLQNYAQVVGMLISLQESQQEPLRRQGRALSVKQ